MSKESTSFIRILGRRDVLVLAFGAMIGFGWIVMTGGFLEEAGTLGAVLAFVTSWFLVLGYLSVVAFEAVALPQTMLYLFPDLLAVRLWSVAGYDVYLSWVAVGVGAAAVMTWVNYRGIRPAAVFQAIAVLFLVAVGAVLLLGSLSEGRPRT